jgi:glycosyltransferase involved in cell wall biosynthesis
MKFSCVMTAYNEGPLLAQSVASVLNQSHEDLELVLVDDGATEETRAVLQAQNDPRIILLQQANDGLSSARNRGLRHCSGDYICFLDGDDLRAPWAFAEVAAALRTDPVELLLVRGALSQPQGALTPFMDEVSALGAEREAKDHPTGAGGGSGGNQGLGGEF